MVESEKDDLEARVANLEKELRSIRIGERNALSRRVIDYNAWLSRASRDGPFLAGPPPPAP